MQKRRGHIRRGWLPDGAEHAARTSFAISNVLLRRAEIKTSTPSGCFKVSKEIKVT